MDINDFMYDDEEVITDDNQDGTQQQQDDSQQQQEEESVIETFLKGQGIQDIHKIKFEDEDGSEIERDWDSLDRDEQLNILKSGQSAPEAELDDEEIELINQIRASRMSPNQYIQSLIPAQQQDEPHYVVDDLSDEELYVLDLQTRIEDATEEQLQNALAKAKEDEELFQKQVAGIRKEYKQLEEDRNAEQEAIQQEQANQQYQQFSNSIIDSIQGLQNIGDLDISMDNEDMNRLASFILDRDATGTSYFAKALNNPEELVKMAWFALNGEEVLNSISNYYKKQINQLSKKGSSTKQEGKVVVKPSGNKPQLNINSIDDLLYS